MQVRVLFFGILKDVTGLSEEQIEIDPPHSLDGLWVRYASRFPQIAAMKPHVRLALNREFSPLHAGLSDGDEVAFLPPVSGGSDQATIALTRNSIDTRSLVESVQSSSDGAVVTFEGIVRDNTKGRITEFLEYEGYEAMALGTMESLAKDLIKKHAIGRVALVHRLGRLQIGEASVVIVVAAPHRKAAFAACLEAIDRLKVTVPIWKKEYFAGGEVWADGEWETGAPLP